MNQQFNLVEYVESQREFFLPVVSDESVAWEKESKFAVQALFKNEMTSKVAASNPVSLQNAIINVAAIGVTLNPAAKHAYLVPRDGAIHLDISYIGLLHLAMQTGSILWGQCKLVKANDVYENQGLDSAPIHKYNAFGDRGAVIGGYCTVKTPSGDYLTEEMSLDEIAKVQNTSKSKNSKYSPWQTFWDEMARKTIVKRASKYWPNVERLDKAIHHLNTEGGEGVDTGESAPTEFVIDVEQSIVALCQEQGKTDTQLFEWMSKAFKREIQCFDDMSEDEKQFIHRKLEGKK